MRRPRIFPSRIPGNSSCVAVAKEFENLEIANDTRSVDQRNDKADHERSLGKRRNI